MNHDELLRFASAPSQGKRPQFFEDPETERVLAIALALAQELAVTRERLDTVERILKRRNLLDENEIDDFQPDVEAAAERGRWQQEYLSRVLRVVLQEIESLQQTADNAASIEELAKD